jgi:hypothetical protein
MVASGLSNPIHLLLLVVVLGIWIGQAALAGYIATRKGRSFNLWLVAGLIVGPLLIIAALLMPRRRSLG